MELFTNNAEGTLSAGISSGDTTIALTGGHGARFPVASPGEDYFYATLIDTSNNREIIKVTNRSTDSLTVVRGQDGTVAQAFLTGDRIALRWNRAMILALQQESTQLHVTAAGTDTYTGTLAPVPENYNTNQVYRVHFTNANTSTAPTLNLNSFGAKTIKNRTGSALLAGQLNGTHHLIYNGTDFILLDPQLAITAQLGDDQVTYAKIQNVTDARVLGRAAGSSGDVQELTAGTRMTISGGNISTTAEINTNSNAGGGAGQFVAAKSGQDLPIRTLTAVNGGTTGGTDVVNNIVVDTSGDTVRVIFTTQAGGGGGTSIHGDSAVEMADGSEKWISDIRLGDRVRGRSGPAEVLGVWRNTLTQDKRSLWNVNGVICTAGHLFPTPEGWAVPSRQAYADRTYGKRRAVKGRRGLIEVVEARVSPEHLAELALGMEILRRDGSFYPVTTLAEYKTNQNGADAPIVPDATIVYALLLEGSDIFYVDGYAVATLA